MPDLEIYHQALNARDARFDGIFYVGITSTGVYCRPVCPAKVSYPDRRRFFSSAAAAEQAGYRPCLRCRPELAPGRAILDAVPRLASIAAQRISSGALNGHGVPDLARELGVSERHLRRALERELGVSPIELAQTCRLLLAKRLLAETTLPVTRIAFASGFQSLRRFNAIFRERYRMSPAALRRSVRAGASDRAGRAGEADHDYIRLSLAYRAPLDWTALLKFLHSDAIPGVEFVAENRYGRTVSLGSRTGTIFMENREPSVVVSIAPSLLPVLMPLLVRIRQVLDLDAEPAVVDQGLKAGGLGDRVREHPGLRLPGSFDGFEAVLKTLLTREQAERLVNALGRRIETGLPDLSRVLPDPTAIAEAGVIRLVDAGIPIRQAETLAGIAHAMIESALRLEPGLDIVATRLALMGIDQMTEDLATRIIMRARPWPDAFPSDDPRLIRAAGTTTSLELATLSNRWRPWRAYAAHHLWLSSLETERLEDGPLTTEAIRSTSCPAV